MLIFAGSAVGFFTRSGNIIPFSVDLSDFYWSFRVKSNTTIKTYLDHNDLFTNEVHNVIGRNIFFEILTTIYYKIIFWTKNRKKCKPWKIISGDFGFCCGYFTIPATGTVFHFRERLSTEFWLWACFGEELHQWLGTLGAGRSKLLLLRKTFKKWFFSVAICCFYTILKSSHLLFMGHFSFFGVFCHS